MNGIEELRRALEQFPGDATISHRLQEVLAPLREYDGRHGSDLVNTMLTYVTREGIAATADALFLHRNSVVYRLQRIEKLTGLPLRQSEVRQLLLVALTLDDPYRLRPQEHALGAEYASQRQE